MVEEEAAQLPDVPDGATVEDMYIDEGPQRPKVGVGDCRHEEGREDDPNPKSEEAEQDVVGREAGEEGGVVAVALLD